MLSGTGVMGSRQRNAVVVDDDDYSKGNYGKYNPQNSKLLPLLYIGLGGFIAIFVMMLTLPRMEIPMDGCGETVKPTESLRHEIINSAIIESNLIANNEVKIPLSPVAVPNEVAQTISENRVELKPVSMVESPPSPTRFTAKYGFYIHVFKHPAAVIHQVEQLNRYFPDSPVYIMSDGGMRFDGLCQKYKCTFQYCPPANDRWHPWPFMHRIRDAAVEMNTEYLIYLEPDNTIHGPINYEPDSDAGGMKDANPKFGKRITDWAEAHARLKDPNFKWGYTGSGLAGGSYFKTSVILDAFSDEKIAELNFTLLRSFDSKRVFSSDFAMPIALSYSGYQYRPWKDIIQWDFPDQPNVTKYAFEHYSRGVDGGKPEYRQSDVLGWQQQKLYEEQLQVFADYRNCEFCWNASAYLERWGTFECANPHPVERHCANARNCTQP
eukprot:m.116250 g.116250  ORF g.116250 m.116250 type:complete len:437 (+) comp28489_c0_seq1:160-1470(+)